jgi:hypothetical protein
VDRLAQRLLAAGKIQHLHDDADVYLRLTLIEQQFKGASGTPMRVCMREKREREAFTDDEWGNPVLIHTSGVMGVELAKLWSHPRLLDLVQQVSHTTSIVH